MLGRDGHLGDLDVGARLLAPAGHVDGLQVDGAGLHVQALVDDAAFFELDVCGDAVISQVGYFEGVIAGRQVADAEEAVEIRVGAVVGPFQDDVAVDDRFAGFLVVDVAADGPAALGVGVIQQDGKEQQ